MKYIESKIENGRATIYLIGNVDSSNAAAVEAEVNEAKGDAKSVTVDCGRLNYISSAGLRSILRLKKADLLKMIFLYLLMVRMLEVWT